MSFPDLIIGGIVVPRLAALTVNQSYDPIGPTALLRLANGDGVIQSNGWSKLSTSISCTGWTREGLDGINWKDPAGVVIACVTPQSIKSPSNSIAIPANRRTDEPVLGYACIGHELVLSPVAVVANVATITPVTGATAYKVEWLPLLTCFCQNGVKASYDSRGNEYGFTLNGEEL